MISLDQITEKTYSVGVDPERIVCNHAYNKETCYCKDFNSKVKSIFCNQKRCKLQLIKHVIKKFDSKNSYSDAK